MSGRGRLMILVAAPPSRSGAAPPRAPLTMALLPLRTLADRPVEQVEREWLDRIAEALARPDCDRALLCRTTLAEILMPEYAASWETAVNDATLPAGTRLALAALDPRNVTLQPEY